MENFTEKYHFRDQYFALPIDVRKAVKADVVERTKCSLGTFNNWLTYGVGGLSPAKQEIKRILEHHSNQKVITRENQMTAFTRIVDFIRAGDGYRCLLFWKGKKTCLICGRKIKIDPLETTKEIYIDTAMCESCQDMYVNQPFCV